MRKLLSILTLLLCLCSSGAWADTAVTYECTSTADVTTLNSKSSQITVGSGTNTFYLYAANALKSSAATSKFSLATDKYQVGQSSDLIVVFVPATSDNIKKIEIYASTSNSRKAYYKSSTDATTLTSSTSTTSSALATTSTSYSPWGDTFAKGTYYAFGGQTGGSGYVYIHQVVVTFEESGPDVTAPTFSLTTPATTSNVAVNTSSIVLTASETVSKVGESVTGTFKAGTADAEAITFDFDASAKTLTYVPTALDYETTYTITVDAEQVQDEAENKNAAAEFTFTTAVEAAEPAGLVAVSNKRWVFSDTDDEKWSSSYAKSNDEVLVNNLGILASAADIAIDSNSKSLDDDKFTYRLKFGSGGSATKQNVHFKIAGGSKITVWGMSSKSGDTRALGITVNGVEQKTDFPGDKLYKAEYNYRGAATDVYVYSTNSGINIYGIQVEELAADTEAPEFTSAPANNADDIDIDAAVTLTANEAITAVGGTIAGTIKAGDAAAEAITFTLDGKVLTYAHDDFAYSTTYVVTLNAEQVQDAAGNKNAAASFSFTTIGEPVAYDFVAPVTYALTTGDTFTSGQTVSVKDKGAVVATITYGEAGGADFTAATADGNVDGYTATTAGNGTNGDKTGGTFYTIVPKYDAIVSVAVALNAGKAFYIQEDGSSLEEYNGITVDVKYYGTYDFKAKANSSYKVYCSGSKLGFYGFTMSPYATVSVSAKGYSTYVNSETALDFTDKSIKAYTISSTDGSALTLTRKDKVAKGEPVLLYSATASDSQPIPAIADGEATATDGNKLVKGTGEAITYAESTAEYYVLVVRDGYTPGFYRANNNTVAATKAYLDLTGLSASARAMSFDLNLDDDNPIATGIDTVRSTEEASGEVFDLQGRKVAQPTRGLYIVNGKKMIIK